VAEPALIGCVVGGVDDELHFDFAEATLLCTDFNLLQPSILVKTLFCLERSLFDIQSDSPSSQYQDGIAHPAIASALCNKSTFVASCFPIPCQTVVQHKSFAICITAWRART
jgi:hypothetical protein